MWALSRFSTSEFFRAKRPFSFVGSIVPHFADVISDTDTGKRSLRARKFASGKPALLWRSVNSTRIRYSVNGDLKSLGQQHKTSQLSHHFPPFKVVLCRILITVFQTFMENTNFIVYNIRSFLGSISVCNKNKNTVPVQLRHQV